MIDQRIIPRYTRKDMASMLGVSLNTFDRRRKEIGFPGGPKYGRARPRWSALEVERIINFLGGEIS